MTLEPSANAHSNISGPPAITPAVMNVQEVAFYLRLSRAHIYNLFKSGELRKIHIGRRTLVRRIDADDFLERASQAG